MIEATSTSLPLPLLKAAFFLKKVHSIWQTAVRVPTYTNPDNFLGLGAGYTLNFVLGDHPLLKIPALPFLVANRLLDLFKQEDAFRSSCGRWMEAVKGVQPITLIEQLSPSGAPFSWRLKAKRLLIRIQRIAIVTLKVAKEGFSLVMRIMDIAEFGDPEQWKSLLDLSVQEGALNISRCLQELSHNKDALTARLQANKATFDSLLGAKSGRSEKLIKWTQEAMERLHTWNQTYKRVAKGVGEWFHGPKKPPFQLPPDELITA